MNELNSTKYIQKGPTSSISVFIIVMQRWLHICETIRYITYINKRKYKRMKENIKTIDIDVYLSEDYL